MFRVKCSAGSIPKYCESWVMIHMKKIDSSWFLTMNWFFCLKVAEMNRFRTLGSHNRPCTSRGHSQASTFKRTPRFLTEKNKLYKKVHKFGLSYQEFTWIWAEIPLAYLKLKSLLFPQWLKVKQFQILNAEITFFWLSQLRSCEKDSWATKKYTKRTLSVL